MKPQEAIKVLNRAKESHLQRAGIDFIKALDLSVSTLEKQIPKKPIDKTLEYDGYYGRCPDCNRVIYDYKDRNRCYNCGQALDWSDTE